MIDLITLISPSLSEDTISGIVVKNKLQTNSTDGLVFYDNLKTKNLSQQKGVFIRVETSQKLKLEGSLHKYYNEIVTGRRSNSNLFTMFQAYESIRHLLLEKLVEEEGLRVYNYEIGLNLNVSTDCLTFMGKMKSIGPYGNEKILYVNPKYKDERVVTTVFPSMARKYFKIYDKVYEMRDRKQKIIPEEYILRIETVHRRLSKCFVKDFFSPANLNKLLEDFFRDWRTVQFHQDIITPKGTGRARQALCEEIMEKGSGAVLKRAKERLKNGSLKEWEFRNIREFIQWEWDVIKNKIQFVKCPEELEFRKLLDVNYKILKNEEFLNPR